MPATRVRIAVLSLSAFLPAALIAGIAAAGMFWGGASSHAFALDGLSEDIVHNYRFVETHPGAADHIPCYCGCVDDGHRSLLDCYVRPEGGYERHASGCGICGMEADLVERLLSEGAEEHSIRLEIDREFGSIGRPTKTPMEHIDE